MWWIFGWIFKIRTAIAARTVPEGIAAMRTDIKARPDKSAGYNGTVLEAALFVRFEIGCVGIGRQSQYRNECNRSVI
jgi:hypothetical protein